MKNNLLFYIVILLLGFCSGYYYHLNYGEKLNKVVMEHKMMDMNMDDMMNSMTERLKGKNGDELDKIFLEDMIIHHKGAINMAHELQRGSKREEMQKMASDIINVQSKEVDMMSGWLKEWFK